MNGVLLDPRDVGRLAAVVREYERRPNRDGTTAPNNTSFINPTTLATPFYVYTSGLKVGITGGSIYRGGLDGVPDVSLTDTGLQDENYWYGIYGSFANKTFYFGIWRTSVSPAFGFWSLETNPLATPPNLTLAKVVFGASAGTITRYYQGGDIWWPTPILSGSVMDASNSTISLLHDAPQAFSVYQLKIKSSSGTVTADLKINGTTIGGIGSVSVSTSETTANYSGTGGTQKIAVGDDLTLVLSGASSLEHVYYTVEMV